MLPIYMNLRRYCDFVILGSDDKEVKDLIRQISKELSIKNLGI